MIDLHIDMLVIFSQNLFLFQWSFGQTVFSAGFGSVGLVGVVIIGLILSTDRTKPDFIFY